MALRRLDDVDPDGVRVVIDWLRFTPGSSVFIPCLDLDECEKQLLAIAERKKWKVTTQICTDHNRLGLRMWRIA